MPRQNSSLPSVLRRTVLLLRTGLLLVATAFQSASSRPAGQQHTWSRTMVTAFTATAPPVRGRVGSSSISASSSVMVRGRRFCATGSSSTTTVEPPPSRVRETTKPNTDRDRRRRGRDEDTSVDEDDNNDNNYSDLEYLIDSMESRELHDPFHILLLGTTFQKPKITVAYCATSLEYVLSLPHAEALEQSQFAQDQGLSCLGTWPREECLVLGRQLQQRDLECRVVPFVEGGQRGWQAKDASSSSSASSASSSFSGSD